jgi:hypothetical protein
MDGWPRSGRLDVQFGFRMTQTARLRCRAPRDKLRSRNAAKQARYRGHLKARTTPRWVDACETVYEALALMPGGDDPNQQRACLSELLTLGAAWYVDRKRKSVTG